MGDQDFREQIAIERKSLNDLFTCCSFERERFERELKALGSFERAAIVIEGFRLGGFYEFQDVRDVLAVVYSPFLARGH